MKKRILSILLSLCMVLMLCPVTVFAANDDATALQNLLNGGGTVTLEKDYTITSTLEVNNTVNLDLNGHVIKMTTSGISVVKVNSGVNLTLQDSDSDAGHDDTSLPAGGVITGGSIPYGDGGGVFVDGGSFTMAGGTISDCYSWNGSGVYVDGGNFTMTGGAIYDCTSAGDGGGVCVQNDGSFEMTGGAISKCRSGGTGGGGVYVNNGSFTMRDGVISGCSAGGVGGGVCAYTKGNFTMDGGTISGCNAGGGSGGVGVAGSFTMNGGAITDCYASSAAGGIELAMNSSFTMNGGTISDCYGPEADAAIAYPEATIYANGGTIMNKVELNGARIENTTKYGGTVFYGGISIVGSGTIIGKKVTFKKDNEPYAIEIVAEGNKAAKPIDPTKEGYEFAGWYDENDTEYDFTQEVTEDIALTAQWEGKEDPVIKGLEKNKTYCDAVEFEVTDNVGVASVTANGVTLTPDANNKYTLEKGTGTVTVVAIDKANNQTSVTVTVNNGHTGGTATCTQKAKCGICGEEYGELANHSLSKTDAKEATCTEDGNIEYWTCSVCHKLFSDENGTNETTLEAVTIKATDHTPGKWEYNSTQHWRFCTVCPAEIDRADHTFSGNTCTVCGYTRPSGGGVSTYAITLESAENGTVTMTPKTASKGTTVTLTVNPDKGYTLETLTVTDKNGNEIELTNKGDGKYTFTMPASKVTVTATFMEDNSMLNFFVDVPADAYYYDAVLWAAENGITGGVDDTHFAPNAPCTRAQIVTFLWRAAGSPEPENVSSFADVSADSYYAKAVAWAVENGITTGTGDGMFSPNATCTRAQAMAFIWRSQKSVATDGVNPFTDVAADAYYADAVLWAVANGITNGTSDTTFSPNANCTRAQIVTFLYRCLG